MLKPSVFRNLFFGTLVFLALSRASCTALDAQASRKFDANPDAYGGGAVPMWESLAVIALWATMWIMVAVAMALLICWLATAFAEKRAAQRAHPD